MDETNKLLAVLAAAHRQSNSKLDTLTLTPAQHASLTSDSSAACAFLLEAMLPGEYDGVRAKAIAEALRARAAKVRAGDTSDLIVDLASQLSWLAGLLAHCTRKGTAQDVSPAAAEIWLRLAIKSQTAYARTALVLANVASRSA